MNAARGGDLDLVDVPPGAALPDQFGLAEPVDRFGEGVVAPIVVNS